jgi:hypothetical protein
VGIAVINAILFLAVGIVATRQKRRDGGAETSAL